MRLFTIYRHSSRRANGVLLFVFVFFMLSGTAAAQFSLRLEQTGGAKQRGENNHFRARLIHDGRELYSIERNLPFDVPFPSAYVHEQSGIVLLSYIFDGFVEVYDTGGKKIWEQQFFKEMGPNYERTITVALGAKTVAFLTSDVTLPNATVRMYSLNGAQRWDAALPYSNGYEILLSPDEKTVIAGSYIFEDQKVKRSAAVLNQEGKETASIDILFRTGAFSDDGSYVAIASENEVAVYSLVTQNIIGRKAKETDGIITAVAWIGKDLIVQESKNIASPEGRLSFADPTFIRYTTTLHELERKTLPVPTFKQSTLRVAGGEVVFTDGNQSVSIFHHVQPLPEKRD